MMTAYQYNRACRVAAWLGVKAPSALLLGTDEGGTEYHRVMQAGADYAAAHGTRCMIELTPELIGLEGKRVEVVDCYGDKRRFWVGRSTGWMPCHLEVSRITSHGGPAVYGAPFESVRVVRSGR